MRTRRIDRLYGQAVRWVAENDDNDPVTVEEVSGTTTVALIADLFGMEPDQVAADVLERRA